MTTAELLADLRAAGVILTADGDHVDVDAPRGTLDDDRRVALVTYKAELLTLLKAETIEPLDSDGWGCPCSTFDTGSFGPGKTPTPSPALAEYPRVVCPSCNADGYWMGDAVTPPPDRERWKCPRCLVGWAVPIGKDPTEVDQSTIIASEAS